MVLNLHHYSASKLFLAVSAGLLDPAYLIWHNAVLGEGGQGKYV